MAAKTVYGGSGNRFAAAWADLILLAMVAGLLGDLSLHRGTLLLAIAFVYFAGMPLTPLKATLGKMLFRIRVVARNGGPLSPAASALRAGAMLGWLATCLVLVNGELLAGVKELATPVLWVLLIAPWATLGVLPRRESLFDVVAGSVVVRWAATPAEIASAEPAQKPGVLNIAGMVFLCVAAGWVIATATLAQRDRDLRMRVVYAMGETQALREKVESFRAREGRWPTAEALGAPARTAYPAGGGYGLEADGTVRIGFEVKPELKGRSIRMKPAAAADGRKVSWQCSADAELRRFVPPSCR